MNIDTSALTPLQARLLFISPAQKRITRKAFKARYKTMKPVHKYTDLGTRSL